MKHIGQIGIYCIENKITHQKYIGQSCNIKNRIYKHKNSLMHGNNDNRYLQKSYNEYGIDNFEFYILELCSLQELDYKEDFYIQKFNTIDRSYGFNMRTGGVIGNHCCQELLDEQSKNRKLYFSNEENRKLQSERSYIQWAKPEIKEKIMGKNNGMYGKHHTEEAKKKVSLANKGRVNWRRNKTPVFCNELNKLFQDATCASKELFLDSGGILKVCKGERKTCGGYHWNFVTN